tara:strand:+ start:876 stop:2516 length:1641 start_codon:yes stop_codon:yes gene_type:complete
MDRLFLFLFLLVSNVRLEVVIPNIEPSNYQTLLNLFNEWRIFERPPILNGAPDYSKERFNRDYDKFSSLKYRLNEIDIQKWPVEYQIDWFVVKAELNGYDFNYKVLKPWERDPAFYQSVWMYESDVPAREGPTNHGTLEFWSYKFPLDKENRKKIKTDLKVIPSLLDQAKINLTGNARDLWMAGIENFKQQSKDLKRIEEKIGLYHSEKDLFKLVENAKNSTLKFTQWLENELPNKTGPSGIGKENYTWYQKNVHLLPFSWEDEVRLLQRELDRAWSSLKLEEHRNRHLPQMVSADTPKAFDILTEKSINKMMKFLKNNDIMKIKSNMEPALRAHRGTFQAKEKRNFFSIGMHYDPLPLYSHFYHWFDLAQVRDEPHPSPIRRGPLLYNIFDSKNEGIATGVEEMFMHAGLYDDNPRSREIVWIMIAQRAARGLGSLYAHANEMTMEEAGKVHVKWTPREWMKREPHLLRFEQHLYLRQPGYGTCYITGKYLIEKMIANRSRQLEELGQSFKIKDFLMQFNDAGNIPVELVHWQITGERPTGLIEP